MTGQVPSGRAWRFLTLVLIVSIPFWAAAVATGGRGWFLGLPVSVVMIVVPAAVASALALRDGGRASLVALWSGLFDFAAVRPRWWWAVGLGAPVLASAPGWLLAATPVKGPDWSLVPVYAAVFYLGAIPEEIGWTRYATAPLTRGYGVLGAGVVIGLVWQFWHVVPHLAQGRSGAWVAGMVTLGVLTRILMVLIFTRGGGSLALACAFHAVLNTCQLYPAGLESFDPWPSVPAMLVVLLATCAVVKYFPGQT